MITSVLVAGAAFVVMEPLTYLAHRFVMHGLGDRLHRSHHRRWPVKREVAGRLEANDAFPVIAASGTMIGLAVGFNVDALSVLVPLCVGISAYGAAYAFVHDVYIHGRLPFPWRHPVLDRLADAHALHHRFGGEPYGMLAPVVPSAVRDRAAGDRAVRDRAVRAADARQRVEAVPGP